MTVTAYYPVIYVNDLEKSLKQYTEDLGFEKRHSVDIGFLKEIVLANGNYRIDLVTTSLDEFKHPDGYYAMRVNVREFDEALNYYESKGYKQMRETVHGVACCHTVLENTDGDRIFLFHHIRKEDRKEA